MSTFPLGFRNGRPLWLNSSDVVWRVEQLHRADLGFDLQSINCTVLLFQWHIMYTSQMTIKGNDGASDCLQCKWPCPNVPPVMYGIHGPLRPLSQSAAALPDEHECLMFKCKFQPYHLAGATPVHNNKPVFRSYIYVNRTNQCHNREIS